MQLARVVGTIVATHKNAALEGRKLLIVQPTDPGGQPRGVAVLAFVAVGAGVGERVLVVSEGKAANQLLGRSQAPVDAAVVGIVDRVALAEDRP
jgi:ethanolamine utilization protein EutN